MTAWRSIPELSCRSCGRRRIEKRLGWPSARRLLEASGKSESLTACQMLLGRTGYRILTARAARTAMTVSEIIDCVIINSLAQDVSGGVSVGENAVLVLNAMNR